MRIVEDSDEKMDGLDEKQAGFLDSVIREAIAACTKNNPHDFHYGLFVLLKGRDDENGTITSLDMMSSLPKDMLHEVIRHWLHNGTH